ncbi:hypothetical protein ACONUD_13185 [Microbulbifer harenosus]|uniref:Chromosome partition protein Smc n=1 Tax=Microbulbifer harenosus TaxID=2576840 RepID=A0ABY2UIF2_9GAMM|nr:hypothetical protein [Microbulbifer harenosus]TLM77402.1 hypothetical protein FDY93_10785 [Microbulbifer harenosus]
MKKKPNLEEEIKWLSTEIEKIKDRIPPNIEDYIREAQQASKKTSEFRNRASEAKQAAETHLQQVQNSIAKIKELESQTLTSKNEIDDLIKHIKNYHEKAKELASSIEQVEEIFSENENLEENISYLKSISESGEQQQSKINAIYKGITSRKNELDSIFYEIMGYEEEIIDEETGEEKTEKVEGLKDKLSASYSKLSNEIKSSKLEIEQLLKKTEMELENEIDLNKSKLEETISNWDSDFKRHSEKIRKLLPDALTAGLSSAYQEKRKAELLERNSSYSSFKWSIFGLFSISLIPFALNSYLFYEGKTLEQILLDLPHTIIAILPVYVPLLWIAYSSGKKVNLSKRLVEEYTHKEVLSKTFEGLSNQIESLGYSEDTTALRIKLLHNILDVSSENPGKLISDYNKADHPIFDALEKSVKLGDAIDKLSKIPGLRRLATTLENNFQSAFYETNKKINNTIDSVIKSKDEDKSEAKKRQPHPEEKNEIA